MDVWALMEAIRSAHKLDVCLTVSLGGRGGFGDWTLSAYVVRLDAAPWEERVLFSMDRRQKVHDTRPLETILYQFLHEVDGEIGRSYVQMPLPAA